MLIAEDQFRREIEHVEQNFCEDIHFGYHSATGKCIGIFSNGLGAERLNPTEDLNHGVVYGAYPLKGVAKFEVEIISHKVGWPGSIGLGVMRYEKGVPIESIPSDAWGAVNHCVWSGQELWDGLVTHSGVSAEYGHVNLLDLRKGDCIGLHLSRNGVLEFFVNGESQGTAAKNIYTGNTDVYAVVDHRCNCVATVITKAGKTIIPLQLFTCFTKSYVATMSTIIIAIFKPINSV